MDKFEKSTRRLIEFIQSSPSAYHVVSNVCDMLEEAGMRRLSENGEWTLQPGDGCFVVRADSSVIAFTVPDGEADNFQIIASHSDSPSFKIKENEEISRAGHYVELNVERYGGMLCAPWFDRPLGIAGRAVVECGGKLVTRLVDFDRDLVMLPSLAVHMNRQANDGASYKIQTDMLPLFGDETAQGGFMKLLAEELDVEKESILGSDLFLYDRSRAAIWGANREYFSCQRLDDLQCAYSSVTAFLESAQERKNENSVCMCCIFDSEEVGSHTKQGAASTFLADTLERICCALGLGRQKQLSMISNGFMISADNGHAVHPNNIDKADPTNRAYMNGGVLIKFNANQKYTTDSVSAAVFKQLCRLNGIPYQVYANHSDIAGGSTLGNISNAHVSLNTIDIGAAQLAMHSPYETGGVKDTLYLQKAMRAFYNTHIGRDENGDYTFISGEIESQLKNS